MASALRNTGISIVGDVPRGTHFCHFYETKQDLLDTLVPYFKAGLESKEFCLWLVSPSEHITVEEAKAALQRAVPDLDRHLSDENIEILNGLDWYLEHTLFDLESVTRAWDTKLKRALALGYDGIRVSGDTLWLREKDREDFCAYERQLTDSMGDRPMTALCSYPLAKSGAAEILDVVQAHQFAIARRQGEWKVLETSELLRAKAEIQRLNAALEQRVIERTSELVAANEALRSEIEARRRVELELRQRAADLAEAQRVAHIGNWSFDLRTNKLIWSEELHRIFGIAKHDFDGRHESFVRRIHPDDHSRVLRANAEARIQGSPFDLEYRIITPNEQVRIIREVGYATQDEAGAVIRLFGTAQDITERKHAEDEVRKQKEILQRIFDHIPVMINFVDAEGRIQLVNREWERTLGWSLEEIRQHNLDVFAECYPDPQYRQQVLQFVAEAKGEWTDFKTRVRDGRVIDTAWIRVHLSDGTRIGIGKDITERNRSRAYLAAGERLSHSGCWAWNVATRSSYWSDERFRILGLEPGSIAPSYETFFAEYVHPEERPHVQRAFDTAVRNRVDYECRYRIVRADGAIRHLHSLAHPVFDTSGALMEYVGTFIDETERVQAEEALREAHDQFEMILNTITDHFFAVDSAWRYTRFNARAAEQLIALGKDPATLIGKVLWDEFPHPHAEETLRRAMQDRVPAIHENYYAPLGEWVENRVYPSADGGLAMFVRYVTQRKRAEEKLKATSEQLRALSARLQSAREEEGARIARELHDELGSVLTSVKFDLALLEREEFPPSNASRLRAKIQTMMQVVDQTVDTVRRISSELRPSVLDDLGLVAAMRWQANQFEAQAGIVFHCTFRLEHVDLKPQQSTAIFRVFQEALTNVRRHARATRVDITLETEDDTLVLTVSDDGQGITAAQQSGRLSLGILGMRERVNLIGGTIDITGVDGHGTVITVRVPIARH